MPKEIEIDIREVFKAFPPKSSKVNSLKNRWIFNNLVVAIRFHYRKIYFDRSNEKKVEVEVNKNVKKAILLFLSEEFIFFVGKTQT